MELDSLIKKLHPLERKIVPFLDSSISVTELEKKSGLSNVEVVRALQWLSNKDVLKIEEEVVETVSLGPNGKDYAKQGLPERRFLKAAEKIEDIGAILKEAKISKDEMNICLGTLKSKAAIDIKKEEGMKITVTAAGKSLLSKVSLEEQFLKKSFPIDISKLADEELFALENLKKRKQILEIGIIKNKTIILTKLGKDLAKSKLSDEDFIDTLTPKIIKSGKWEGKQFRSYDVTVNVPKISRGRRHFVNQAADYVKRVWLDLGFVEMEGNMVHTSFWDLDSLFVPQDHPARAMQDTFYVKDENKKKILEGTLPKGISDNVKETHETGGNTGSKGWQQKWSPEVAKEVLLRTHTTVLSAKTISNLKKEDLPAKFFSVGKVFRNERMDWKHLFEFYQVEGIVVDPDANFSNLLGYLREFFGKMGYKDVRIRPAHFPYTEPSAEIEVLHPTKNEWIELGGCGIFRPEVTKTLLGFECPVLAWGMGLGRIIIEYFNITDLRDLYRNDLKQLREMKEWMR